MRKKIGVKSDFTSVYKRLIAVGATEIGSSCERPGIDESQRSRLGTGWKSWNPRNEPAVGIFPTMRLQCGLALGRRAAVRGLSFFGMVAKKFAFGRAVEVALLRSTKRGECGWFNTTVHFQRFDVMSFSRVG